MHEKEIIHIDSDSDADEDEDLRRAIELSLQDQRGEAAPETSSGVQMKASPEKAMFGALQLDRKKMEEARLSRLGQKRPRASSASDQDHHPTPKRSVAVRPGPKRYLKGAVKRTWARGYPEDSDHYVKIEQVLHAERLKLALLSSFQWDEEWLLSKINLAQTKVLLLASAPDEQTVSISSNAYFTCVLLID